MRLLFWPNLPFEISSFKKTEQRSTLDVYAIEIAIVFVSMIGRLCLSWANCVAYSKHCDCRPLTLCMLTELGVVHVTPIFDSTLVVWNLG